MLPRLVKETDRHTETIIEKLNARYRDLMSLTQHLQTNVDDPNISGPVQQHLAAIALGKGGVLSSLEVLKYGYLEGATKLEALSERQGKVLLRNLLKTLLKQQIFRSMDEIRAAKKVLDLLK